MALCCSVVVFLAILVLLFLLFVILAKLLSLLVEIDDTTRSKRIAAAENIASASEVEGVGKRLRAPRCCIVLARISLDYVALVALSSGTKRSHIAHASPRSVVVALRCSALQSSANVSSVFLHTICRSGSLRSFCFACSGGGLRSFGIIIHNLLLAIAPSHRLSRRCCSSLLCLDARCLAVSDQLAIDSLLVGEAKLLADLGQLLKSLRRVKLEVALQLLVADRAKRLDTASAMLVGAHDTVHEVLVVDTVAQAELMTKLVSHDVASVHEQVLLSVRVLNSVPRRVEATERESADTLSETGPAEAE